MFLPTHYFMSHKVDRPCFLACSFPLRKLKLFSVFQAKCHKSNAFENSNSYFYLIVWSIWQEVCVFFFQILRSLPCILFFVCSFISFLSSSFPFFNAEVDTRALHMLENCSTIKPHPLSFLMECVNLCRKISMWFNSQRQK